MSIDLTPTPPPVPDPADDVQCSEAALAAAEEISSAWTWDIRLSKVGAIIDRHCPPAKISQGDEPEFTAENVAAVAAEVARDLEEDIEALKAQVADYEVTLRAIRDDDGTGDFCSGVAAREALKRWENRA